MNEVLLRIAEALERIANHLEEPKPKRTRAPKTGVVPKTTHKVIAAYCEAYKKRYGINPIVDGKTQGLASTLTQTLPIERCSDLLQAYLQMEDDWFKKKCHDFPTFTMNLGKVAISLANGTENPHEKKYWARIFGGENDARSISAADEATSGGLGTKQLLGPGDPEIMAGLQNDT